MTITHELRYDESGDLLTENGALVYVRVEEDGRRYSRRAIVPNDLDLEDEQAVSGWLDSYLNPPPPPPPTLEDWKDKAKANVTAWELENKNAPITYGGETYACDDLAEGRFLKIQAAITEHGHVAPHCDEEGDVKWWAASGPVTLSPSDWTALTLAMLNQRYMYENAAIYLREAAIPAAADLTALNAILTANGVETVGPAA